MGGREGAHDGCKGEAGAIATVGDAEIRGRVATVRREGHGVQGAASVGSAVPLRCGTGACIQRAGPRLFIDRRAARIRIGATVAVRVVRVTGAWRVTSCAGGVVITRSDGARVGPAEARVGFGRRCRYAGEGMEEVAILGR